MRRVTGYVDGKPIWSDNTPGAYARVPGHSGSMVSGDSGPVQRHREKAHKSGDKSLERAALNSESHGVNAPEVPTVSAAP